MFYFPFSLDNYLIFLLKIPTSFAICFAQLRVYFSPKWDTENQIFRGKTILMSGISGCIDGTWMAHRRHINPVHKLPLWRTRARAAYLSTCPTWRDWLRRNCALVFGNYKSGENGTEALGTTA